MWPTRMVSPALTDPPPVEAGDASSAFFSRHPSVRRTSARSSTVKASRFIPLLLPHSDALEYTDEGARGAFLPQTAGRGRHVRDREGPARAPGAVHPRPV